MREQCALSCQALGSSDGDEPSRSRFNPVVHHHSSLPTATQPRGSTAQTTPHPFHQPLDPKAQRCPANQGNSTPTATGRPRRVRTSIPAAQGTYPSSSALRCSGVAQLGVTCITIP